MRPPNRPDVRPDLTNDHVEIKWVRTWLEKWAREAELRTGGVILTSRVDGYRSYYNPPPNYCEMLDRADDELVAENPRNKKYIDAAYWCAMLGPRRAGLVLRLGKTCIHERRQVGERLLQQRLGLMIERDRRKKRTVRKVAPSAKIRHTSTVERHK